MRTTLGEQIYAPEGSPDDFQASLKTPGRFRVVAIRRGGHVSAFDCDSHRHALLLLDRLEQNHPEIASASIWPDDGEELEGFAN